METRDSSKMEAAAPESEIALHGEYCLSRSLSLSADDKDTV